MLKWVVNFFVFFDFPKFSDVQIVFSNKFNVEISITSIFGLFSVCRIVKIFATFSRPNKKFHAEIEYCQFFELYRFLGFSIFFWPQIRVQRKSSLQNEFNVIFKLSGFFRIFSNFLTSESHSARNLTLRWIWRTFFVFLKFSGFSKALWTRLM